MRPAFILLSDNAKSSPPGCTRKKALIQADVKQKKDVNYQISLWKSRPMNLQFNNRARTIIKLLFKESDVESISY